MQNSYTWYTHKSNINSPGTVHQILAYGNLGAIRAIKKKLGKEKLREVFLQYPQKVYTPSALNFIAKFILCIPNQIDENRYLKTTPRHIG